jgi:hypothetical protein
MEPNRYQQGKIYKIVSPHTDMIYIGSTCKEYLSQRLVAHRASFKQWQKGKGGNASSYRLLEQGDVEIILLESYPCNSKDELTARERYWIDQNNNLLNKIRPSLTEEEKNYYQNHKIEHNEKSKQYYLINKEIISNRKSIKYNCVCGSSIRTSDKSQHEKTDKHQTYLMIQTL